MMAVPVSRRWCWPLLIGVVAAGSTSLDISRSQPVGYADARTVVERRCLECHSERPTNRAFPIAPRGVMLDTALQMKQYARRIEARVVMERTMPLANMSGMPTRSAGFSVVGWRRAPKSLASPRKPRIRADAVHLTVMAPLVARQKVQHLRHIVGAHQRVLGCHLQKIQIGIAVDQLLRLLERGSQIGDQFSLCPSRPRRRHVRIARRQNRKLGNQADH